VCVLHSLLLAEDFLVPSGQILRIDLDRLGALAELIRSHEDAGISYSN
jgi:hypothetical protein